MTPYEAQYAPQAIEQFIIPSPAQMHATASRLGMPSQGSAFAALSAVDFSTWIEETDKEYDLIIYITDKTVPGYRRGSDQAQLAKLLRRAYRLPLAG